jgi:hypothetical protein
MDGYSSTIVHSTRRSTRRGPAGKCTVAHRSHTQRPREDQSRGEFVFFPPELGNLFHDFICVIISTMQSRLDSFTFAVVHRELESTIQSDCRCPMSYDMK